MILSLASPLVAAACLVSRALAQQAALPARQPAALIHGNYCGVGNNAPLPPVGALDLACARHDACTPRDELGSRACNLRFQHEAEFIARDPRQPDELRALAGFLSAGAALLPSEPDAAVLVTRGPPPGRVAWPPPVFQPTGGIE